MARTFEEISDVLDSEQETSISFRSALAELEQLAKQGDFEAVEAIAEIFGFSQHHRDTARAYFWYHVALGAKGYATAFANSHGAGEPYCGPVGDFRNEAQVNELVSHLGEVRARQLDQVAQEWLRKNRAV